MSHVLITDDQPIFIMGLEAALHSSCPNIQTYQATHLEAAKAQLKQHPVIPLLLLDCCLPEDSVQHLPELWAVSPHLRIALMSDCKSHPRLQKALQAGIVGIIPKTLPVDSLVKAVQHLLAGNPYMPAQLASPPHDVLSVRQIEILAYAAEGYTNRQIATELCLTEGTVKQHFSNILRALQAENRTHAIQIARNHGLIC